MTVETRNRSRLAILNYVMQFFLTHEWGPEVGRKGSLHGFISNIRDELPPRVGDLVTLSSAPATKWYLAWLREIEPRGDRFSTRYLLESIEDGALCWWSNAGVDYMDREVTDQHPEWQWTDRQWAFKDRWYKACFKERDAYMILPTYPQFGAGYIVTLGTRERWGGLRGEQHLPKKEFPDWRKLTKAQMAEFYDECVASQPKETT